MAFSPNCAVAKRHGSDEEAKQKDANIKDKKQSLGKAGDGYEMDKAEWGRDDYLRGKTSEKAREESEGKSSRRITGPAGRFRTEPPIRSLRAQAQA